MGKKKAPKKEAPVKGPLTMEDLKNLPLKDLKAMAFDLEQQAKQIQGMFNYITQIIASRPPEPVEVAGEPPVE